MSKYEVLYSYSGYEVGKDDSNNIFISKDFSDDSYSTIEVASFQEAHEYIDTITVNSDD